MVPIGRFPPYLRDALILVSFSSGRSGLWSATTAQYVKPRIRTVFGERAFSFAGPKSYVVYFELPVSPQKIMLNFICQQVCDEGYRRSKRKKKEPVFEEHPALVVRYISNDKGLNCYF